MISKLPFYKVCFFLLLFQFGTANAQSKFTTPYGNNDAVGKYVKVNGTKIYYEEYGKGEPLVLIHSCGADIKAMEYQIDYFKNKYRVIAVDSRGQGKSELKAISLTYDKMAKDMEKLVTRLQLDSINILGWSDGGIIALKMGINNKVPIKKIVTMGANLRPDTTAINTWAYDKVREMNGKTLNMIIKGDTSKNWKKELLFDNLLMNQPNISHAELKKITASVLLIIGDRDIIKNEHAVEIFNNIPKAQLCIMPGGDHGAPRNNSVFFNQMADKFLSEDFDYSE
ncbi:alpha/beta hydrolase [Tenacibaculum tangerinum]|uniref:Alpha/beta hydrolase n=1 Tax=Tenacibaculum tangerinum TaxID=3038772 RepID=A0ABY8L0P6_9FLAO|nr:alpha/beta hydrolase [Tenacibaculum tangerinum]WGH75037.1 alpha/beta hydrolase [Tenacibaculum tangerinum]